MKVVPSPLIIDCLDDEAESWAHGAHILLHYALHNGSFASIVQSSTLVNFVPDAQENLQHQNSHLLVLQTGFP